MCIRDRNKPHSLAALAYDLVGLINSLSIENSQITKNILHSESGYKGINGWFRFIESGRVERKPIIFHVNDDKFIVKN